MAARFPRHAKNVATEQIELAARPKRQRVLDLLQDDSEVSELDSDVSSNSSSGDSSDENSESDDDTAETPNDWTFEDGASLPDAGDVDSLNPFPFLQESASLAVDFDPISSDSVTYADLFLCDNLLSSICTWTNTRAHMHHQSLLHQRKDVAAAAFDRQWKDVQLDEFRGFLAQVFLMGIIRKPDIRSYWSTDFLYTTPIFLDCSTLSRDRFLFILKFLRFSDPNEYNPEDKYSRLSQFFVKMNNINKETYHPQRKLNVDESLMLWKGRLRFRVFIRTKRARFGLKFFLLSDSDGYMIQSVMYTGNQDDWLDGVPCGELTMSNKIVGHLLNMAGLLDKMYAVYIDNWFNSYSLMTWLKSRQTLASGTIRQNRGLPECLTKKQLKKGDFTFAKKDNVLAIKFNDRKEMFFSSNFHLATTVQKQRIRRGGAREDYKKPGPIEDYNYHMNGTDKQDQLLQPYRCIRKSYKWFVKTGIHFLQRMLLNGFIVYCKTTPRPLPSNTNILNFKGFTEAYIRRYIHCKGPAARVGELLRRPVKRVRPVEPQPAANDGNQGHPREQHDLQRIPPTAKKDKPTRKCQYCCIYLKKRRRETSYFCPKCPGTPSLCVGECASKWHQNV